MTMRPRRSRATMMRGAMMCSLCLVGSEASEDSKSGFLRRKKSSDRSDSVGGRESADEETPFNPGLANMEDLWAQAATAAKIELDAERLLWSGSSSDLSMSMPTRPPDSQPTPRPTRRPVGPPVDCLQGRSRAEYIFDLLVQITPSSILNDLTTPQGMAFEYLANDDPYLGDPCQSDTIEQRYGLTTLYYSTEGQSWLTNLGWLGQDQECLWYGIECDSGDPEIVSRITLSNNNLVGSLTDEIKAIENLERINLFANTVTGTIPEGISELTNLILLDLEQNLLSGQAFPSQLFEIRSLLAYRASDNFLSGSIPTDIQRLQRLQQLWIAITEVTGTIPTEIALQTDLESIFLYENKMFGTLPSELGNLSNLEDLRIYGNHIENTIPTELFEATKLESLRLEFNFFSGTIPTEVGNLVVLTDLRVDTNSLKGSLPSEIGNLAMLENFIINNNFFSGQIPNVFDRMTQLDFVDAVNNGFTGSIPETIFQAPLIRLVYLSNNTLTGTIPVEYSQPSLLRDLYLDGNSLVGTVPSISSGQMQDLNEFLVHFNFLSGSMPASICGLRGNDGNLNDLFADCGGQSPEIDCDFPGCCNRCFEGGIVPRRRTEMDMKGGWLRG